MRWKKMKARRHYVDGRQYLLLFKAIPGTLTTGDQAAEPVLAIFRNREGQAAPFCWDTGKGPVLFGCDMFSGYIDIPAY